MRVEDRRSVEVVDRDVEEALNLLGVQVDRQDAVGAGGGEQIGDELGRDRHAGLVLTILAGVTKERDHGRDAGGGRASEGVDHDQQLHDAIVGRRTGGLDDVDVAATDILIDLHERLAVGETVDGSGAERNAEMFADFLGQRRIGVAGENLHLR